MNADQPPRGRSRRSELNSDGPGPRQLTVLGDDDGPDDGDGSA
jgi:hypothetical protein